MSEQKSSPRWKIILWLAVSQIFYMLLLIPWAGVSMMSVMAFDEGINTQNVLFVGAIWSYPLWVILFSVLAWLAYKRGKDKAALVWTGIPLALILAGAGVFTLLVNLGF